MIDEPTKLEKATNSQKEDKNKQSNYSKHKEMEKKEK